MKLFDTSWQPLALDEPDWYEKVTTFIEQGINPETTDELGLNLAGPDGKTFLFLILTVAAPKLKRQVQASRITFQQRRDLFRWLMCKYPTLYRDGAEHLGYSIFEMVIQRAERIHKDVRENDRLFIEFFMTNYPEQASTLLNADAAKEGAKGIPLVHQLLPMMKAKKSLGSLSLLHHLDKLTILQRDQSGNTVFHLAVAYNFMCDEGTPSQNQLLKGIQSMLERCEDALRCTNRQGQSPYQYRVDTYGQMRLANSVEKGLPLADDPIAQYLKDRYMHFEKRDEIIKYLHGVVQGNLRHLDTKCLL